VWDSILRENSNLGLILDLGQLILNNYKLDQINNYKIINIHLRDPSVNYDFTDLLLELNKFYDGFLCLEYNNISLDVNARIDNLKHDLNKYYKLLDKSNSIYDRTTQYDNTGDLKEAANDYLDMNWPIVPLMYRS